MTLKTKTKVGDSGMKIAEEAPNQAVARFGDLRLPYHEAFKERFGVDKGAYKVLVEAIWPNAETVDAIALALSYCRARNLDPMKRVVHIVPMWNSALRRTVETVWPGIAELRTTAFRTQNYAGIEAVELGEEVELTFEGMTRGREPQTLSKTVKVPEWARFTVYRFVNGVRCPFVGPKVYWQEAFADIAGSGVPNQMWEERPVGQLEKCAEAGALRRAFPEELGNTYAAEEMEGRNLANAAAAAAELPGVGGPPQPKAEPAADMEPPSPTRPASEPEPATGQSAPPVQEPKQAAATTPADRQKPRLTADHSALLRDAMLKRIAALANKAALTKWFDSSKAEIETLLDDDRQTVIDAAQEKMLGLDEQAGE